jgi:hypothetical protein
MRPFLCGWGFRGEEKYGAFVVDRSFVPVTALRDGAAFRGFFSLKFLVVQTYLELQLLRIVQSEGCLGR